MKAEVFGAGTIPGSPSSNNEIKTLLCLLMTEEPKGLSFEQIHEILQEERLVNYFELIGNLEQLVESKHLLLHRVGETERYEVTELGIKTAKELYTDVSYSVRDRALAGMRRVLGREQRLRDIRADIEKTEDGYRVHLAIPDPGTDLIALSVFAPTKIEAQAIRARFLNDPVFLYKGILSLLQGDQEILGELLPSESKLF